MPADVPKFFSKKELQSIISQNSIVFSKINQLDKKDFFCSSPPTIFVGSKLKYPAVNVGILSPPEETQDAWLYDAQTYWPGTDFTIRDIIALRSALINSRFQTKVDSVRGSNKFTEIAQEIGIGKEPVDVEIELQKKPVLKTDYDSIRLPMGPAVQLQKARIVENVKVDNRVDKIISDTDLKAAEGMQMLYEKGIDEHVISQLLTLGTLGLKKNRRLVPTRWGITASDDALGKAIIDEIQDYGEIDEYRLYMGNYFGNYYYILMFPGCWQYELFEGYLPKSAWNKESSVKWATDAEGIFGRKTYASNTVGGFYASRLGVLEQLRRIRKQASVLVIRFETPEYFAALGVWVVRSASRRTMSNLPKTFDSREGLLNAVKDEIYTRFRYNIDDIYSMSKLLKILKTQKRLAEFF